MTTVHAVEPALTRAGYHRVRDDPPEAVTPATNGATPERRACETCGGSLSPSQTRFCSKPCAARGVSRDRKAAAKKPPADVDQSSEFGKSAAAGIGLLVAQLLAVVQVGEVEMQFSGVRVFVRTRPEGVADAR
jgi:hypothetical protein